VGSVCGGGGFVGEVGRGVCCSYEVGSISLNSGSTVRRVFLFLHSGG
jgi:hypothetical protein